VLYLGTHGQEALLAHTRETLAAAARTSSRSTRRRAGPRALPAARRRAGRAVRGRGARTSTCTRCTRASCAACVGDGGVLRTDAALVGARRDGARWALQLAGGEVVHAHVVVDAAGAWADEVATLCGARPLGLVPCRRSAFTFDAPQGVDVAGWPTVVCADEGWYFKPDAGRLLGSPANADPTLPHDVVPEELDIALGIDRIQA
jgi:D-arginine dehydrogenase